MPGGVAAGRRDRRYLRRTGAALAAYPRSRLWNDGHHLDLDQKIRVRQAAHFDRGARRQVVAAVFHAGFDVLEIGIDIGGEGLPFDDVVHGCARRRERGLDVREHLADLRRHVALADDLALAVARQNAGHEYELARYHGHDRRVEHMAFDDPLRHPFGENVFALNHDIAPLAAGSGDRPWPTMVNVAAGPAYRIEPLTRA